MGDASAEGADNGAGKLLQVLEERSDDGVLTVSLEGELDLATADRVREPLERAVEAGTRRVVIDMLSCSFIDSTGLGVLLHCAKQLEEERGGMALVCTDDQIKRLLELTMIDRTIPVFDTREQALAELDGTAAA